MVFGCLELQETNRICWVNSHKRHDKSKLKMYQHRKFVISVIKFDFCTKMLSASKASFLQLYYYTYTKMLSASKASFLQPY